MSEHEDRNGTAHPTRVERAAADNETTNIDLTSNNSNDQPNRLFSDGQPPPSGHTPQTTTTGSTTLPQDNVATTENTTPIKRSSCIAQGCTKERRIGYVYCAEHLKEFQKFHGLWEEPPLPSVASLVADEMLIQAEGAPPTTLENPEDPMPSDGIRELQDQLAECQAALADARSISYEDHVARLVDETKALNGQIDEATTLNRTLQDRVLMLESQLATSVALEQRLQVRIDSDTQRLQELRRANIQLLDHNSALLDEKHLLSREKHDLALALDKVNGALHDAIEHIKSLAHNRPTLVKTPAPAPVPASTDKKEPR